METETFAFRRVGTTGCEIRNPDGQIIGWTVDSVWAARIVALLNGADDVSLTTACTAPTETRNNTARQPHCTKSDGVAEPIGLNNRQPPRPGTGGGGKEHGGLRFQHYHSAVQ